MDYYGTEVVRETIDISELQPNYVDLVAAHGISKPPTTVAAATTTSDRGMLSILYRIYSPCDKG